MSQLPLFSPCLLPCYKPTSATISTSPQTFLLYSIEEMAGMGKKVSNWFASSLTLLNVLKIFVPVMFLALAVLIPVNNTNNTLELLKVTYSKIDKLSISNIERGSSRFLLPHKLQERKARDGFCPETTYTEWITRTSFSLHVLPRCVKIMDWLMSSIYLSFLL